MKYAAMESLREKHSVRKMAKVLNIKESAFYQWRKREKEKDKKKIEQEKLVSEVRKIFDESRQTYGYRKVANTLADEGTEMSEYKVRQIMRSNGMHPVTAIKYRPGKPAKATGRYLDNLFNQDFSTTRLNEKWAGDITYIKTKIGWVYLVCIIDLHNKEIVGYAISKKADTELVCRALSYALIRRNITDKDLLTFHSDRGVQFASRRFQAMLSANGITGSMSKAGCPYDNAPVESFFSSAKRECIYRKEYSDITEVCKDIFDYIEVFYNRKRIQAGLGNKSPLAYRKDIEAQKAA